MEAAKVQRDEAHIITYHQDDIEPVRYDISYYPPDIEHDSDD
jgi:hypothetical protein